MNILLPANITDNSNVALLLDQIFVTIESYYRFNSSNDTFIIFTNSADIINGIKLFNIGFEKDVRTELINFEKCWEDTGLVITQSKARRATIIAKMLMPFIFDEDYLLMDWDVMTTGRSVPEMIQSDKLRFFNSKLYDGNTLRQISMWKNMFPEKNSTGRFRWVNSGFAYFPKDLTKQMILEYWEKYNSITEQQYKNIFLYDIIGDEYIYNLMLIDEDPRIEECTEYNINVVLRNFYSNFFKINSMYSFGERSPHVLNVHFAIGHIKPFNVVIDDSGNLSCTIKMEKYNTDKESVRWLFDIAEHKCGAFHYNTVVFSLIWQYTRYCIREQMGLMKENMSTRYLDFFNKNIIEI